MRERRKIKVDGQMTPVMALNIKPKYYPPAPRKANFPDAPKGLSKAALEKWMRETSGKVDAAIAAENARWQKEREPDTQIRIEFMAWAWEGREIGGEHVKSIDGAWMDVHGLHLPDGRVIHGRGVDLPNDRICANAAILREERESGVSYERIIETVKSEHATTRKRMAKAAKYGFSLAMNERDKGAKRVGGQEKEKPERIRKALRKVDAILDAKPMPGEKPTRARKACIDIHAEMKLGISAGRLQNIHSSPQERERIGYKKTSASTRLSRR